MHVSNVKAACSPKIQKKAYKLPFDELPVLKKLLEVLALLLVVCNPRLVTIGTGAGACSRLHIFRHSKSEEYCALSCVEVVLDRWSPRV